MTIKKKVAQYVNEWIKSTMRMISLKKVLFIKFLALKAVNFEYIEQVAKWVVCVLWLLLQDL